jgi:ATP-dependent Clp protease ATP-binding subunit ClpC
MFERFTERARQVVALSQEEATLLKHRAIGSEHLLLGMLREEQGMAAQALTAGGVWVDKARAVIAARHETADAVAQVPFAPDAKRVLERSLREAVRLGHNYIGTEHLLLGLLRDEECEGFAVLQELGVDVEELRELTLTLIATRPERRTLPYAPDLAGALSRATEAAREGGDEQVELRHLRQVLERT